MSHIIFQQSQSKIFIFVGKNLETSNLVTNQINKIGKSQRQLSWVN